MGMRWIDKNVSVQPRWYRRHDQNSRPRLLNPCEAEVLAYGLALAVPSRMLGGVEDFIASAVGNSDADIMLAFGDYRAGVDQLFEHGSRVIFGGVDERAGGRIPTPWIEACALAVINRMRALRITYTKAG